MAPHHIHTFAVDNSLSVEDAWKELCIIGVRATFTGGESWANIECDGEECRNIVEDLD